MFRQAVLKLIRERHYVIKGLLVSVVLGVMLSFVVAGRYTSATRIIPPQQIQSTLTGLVGQMGTMSFSGLAGLRNPSDVYVQLLRTDSIAHALINRFKLYDHYGKEKFEDVRLMLDRRSRIRAGRDGMVLMEVNDKDADMAAALANGYAEELFKLIQRLSAEETAQRKQFVDSKLAEITKSLDAKEQDFRKLQERVGVLSVEGGIDATYTAIGTLRASIMMREVALRTISNSSTSQNPTYRNMEAEIAALKSQMEKLEQDPKIQNPKFMIPANRAPEIVMEYVRKLRDIKLEEGMYKVMQKQAELVRMEDLRDFMQFLIVDTARPATRRDFPSRLVVTLLTCFLGMTLVIYLVITDRIWRLSDIWRDNKLDVGQVNGP